MPTARLRHMLLQLWREGAHFTGATQRHFTSVRGTRMGSWPVEHQVTAQQLWAPIFPLHSCPACKRLVVVCRSQPFGTGKEKPLDTLELTEEKFSALTDQIPQKPVGVVEGTSYMLVIIMALGVLGLFLYNFVVTFVLEPVSIQCYHVALEKLKGDPRITVRLGDDITSYGQESRSALSRGQIPHVVYKDEKGVEHVRLQFYMRGQGGMAMVTADMYRDDDGEWQYTYLVADIKSYTSQYGQRLNIVTPSITFSARA